MEYSFQSSHANIFGRDYPETFEEIKRSCGIKDTPGQPKFEKFEAEPWDEEKINACVDILGVRKGSNQRQCTQAYKIQSLRWHPDKCKDPLAEETFKNLSNSYQYLMTVYYKNQ